MGKEGKEKRDNLTLVSVACKNLDAEVMFSLFFFSLSLTLSPKSVSLLMSWSLLLFQVQLGESLSQASNGEAFKEG